MLRINIIKNNKEIKKIEFLGHANYNEYGKDIVCAATSATMLCTANAIISIDDKAIDVIEKPNNITINILKNDEITNKLIINMLNCLESLEKDYPKNIKINKEEE